MSLFSKVLKSLNWFMTKTFNILNRSLRIMSINVNYFNDFPYLYIFSALTISCFIINGEIDFWD